MAIYVYTTRLVAVALIILPFTFSHGADCIARSRDLADSVFNNTVNEIDNWDNLRRAYFPPNNRENQIVTISYYYPQTSDNSSMEEFRWSWSPAVFYIYPYAFKYLALLAVDLKKVHTSVNITTPFCNITKKDRLSLLNEFTTVVRGYVVNGYSPGQRLIDVHQIGYASYYNTVNNIYENLEDQSQINLFFVMLIVSTATASFLLPLCCGPCFLNNIFKQHFGSSTTPKNEERRSKLLLASLLVSNLSGIYAFIIDILHIKHEKDKSNHDDNHYSLYDGWIGALVVMVVFDFIVAIASIIVTQENTHPPVNDTSQTTVQIELDTLSNCSTTYQSIDRTSGNSSHAITNEKRGGESLCHNKFKFLITWIRMHKCRIFWITLPLFFSQVLLFHLIFIGLAFLSYPAEAFGIVYVSLSAATMCTISLALVCFAWSHSKCISILLFIISLFLCTAYTIILVSLVHVTQFFDYTDDFADSTVNSISITVLSAAIAIVPSFILTTQYNHLCEMIEHGCKS